MLIHADDILGLIRKHGWYRGDGHFGESGERICLAMSLSRVAVSQGYRDLTGEWAAWDRELARAAAELYPERSNWRLSAQNAHIAFNDHPDTTFEDVERVVKEAERLL